MSRKAFDPRTRVDQTTYKRTLSTVNRMREIFGMKPLARMPHGVPLDERYCPIAKALDHGRVRVTGARVGFPVSKRGRYTETSILAVAKTLGLTQKNISKFLWEDETFIGRIPIFERFVREFDHNSL